MADNFAAARGAESRTNLLMFDPENLNIVTDPTHPLWDERVDLPVDAALVASICVHGVLEPVLVAQDGPNTLSVVDGRQRVRAARVAQQQTGKPVRVGAIIKRGTTSELFGLTIAANEIRTADTATVRAKKLRRLYEMTGSVDKVALAFGLAPNAVRQSLKLLDAPEEIQEAVDSRRISLAQGVAIATKGRSEQKAAADRILAKTAGTGEPKASRGYMRTCQSKGNLKTAQVLFQARLDEAGPDALSQDGAMSVRAAVTALAWALGEDVRPLEEILQYLSDQSA